MQWKNVLWQLWQLDTESNVVPNAQLVTFDRLGLNSVLFLANFLTYTKVRFIANFFQWNTLEPSFPFKLPEKRPQKIDGLKAIAYQMTACMHIGYAICNTSVFLLCICCNRLPFWVYCVWKKARKYQYSSLSMHSFCIQANVLIKKWFYYIHTIWGRAARCRLFLIIKSTSYCLEMLVVVKYNLRNQDILMS